MKVAILTHPLWTNYGGLLQAYAMQTIMERKGHEVVIINREYRDYPSLKLYLMRLISALKCIVRVYLLGKKEYVIMNPISAYYHTQWRGYDVLPFVKQYINHSKEIRNSKSLKQYFKRNHFDCYLVGSDQVWRPCYVANVTDYFLKEIPLNSNSIKVAYAASFGTDQWEFSEEETKECATLVKLFDAISVRENSGVKLCKQYLGVDAEHVLDPTMLLDEEDYVCLFKKVRESKVKGDLFCYVLDENIEADRIINHLKVEGYIPYYAYLNVHSTKDNPRPYQLSVEEWLRGIYDAEFVVTDSFHACVFSILFKKKFVVLGNKVRGNTRFDSLLDMFGLQKRMVESYDFFLQVKTSLFGGEDINDAQKFLTSYRLTSVKFLKNANLL